MCLIIVNMADMMAAASLISAGVGIGTLGYNIFSGERGYQAQMSEFDRSMAFQRESRDMYYDKNSYVSRVADLKAAGLHPALAVQGASGPGGFQGSPPQSRTPMPHVSSSDVQVAVQNMLAARQLQNQTVQTQADADLARAQASRIRTETRAMNLKEGREQEEHNLNIKLMYHQLFQQPLRYRNMLLDIASSELHNDRERLALVEDVLRQRSIELSNYSEELHQAAQLLGLDHDSLVNAILAHDYNIIKDSQFESNENSSQTDIEHYLRTLIPGDSNAAQTVRRILQPILTTIDTMQTRAIDAVKAYRGRRTYGF